MSQSTTTNQEGFFSKLKDKTSKFLEKIPITTRFFFILCVVIFILEIIIPISIVTSVCRSPTLGIFKNLYRTLISHYFHLDILHILFNMLSFVPIGSILERVKFGSFQLFYLIALFSGLIPMVMLLISMVLMFLESGTIKFPYYNCTIGLSGIIFALFEIHFFKNETVSFYGITEIPSKLYPFAILLITYLIFPYSSLIGHLSGIIVGYLFVKGYLDIFLLSYSKMIEIESSRTCNFMTSTSGFIGNLNYNLQNANLNVSPTNSSSNSGGSGSNGITSKFKEYISSFKSESGRQLGTILSNQQSEQFDDQQEIEVNIESSNNNNINNNGSLNYSPLIDMSRQ